MRMLVTAGPTREYIDPVRYLSNESSGRMGYAIARAAKRRGHDVALISGPTALRPPKGVETLNVTSARDMRAAVLERFPEHDALVMAAAVADFRPRKRARRKIKKETASSSIELVRNPDVVAEAARKKGDRTVVGFALETNDGPANAMSKLERKRLDFVVLNSPAVLGRDDTTVHILGPDGPIEALRSRTKDSVGTSIVRIVERARSSHDGPSRAEAEITTKRKRTR